MVLGFGGLHTKSPSIRIRPTWGPKVNTCYIHWVVWILRDRACVFFAPINLKWGLGFRGLGFTV